MSPLHQLILSQASSLDPHNSVSPMLSSLPQQLLQDKLHPSVEVILPFLQKAITEVLSFPQCLALN